MKSPLAVDKETVKKYKITEDVEVSPLAKLSFLENQLNELKLMQWRSRVDVVHATRLQESKNEVLKAKGNNNYAEHANQVEQFTGAIKMISTMIDELKKEYPELVE